MPPAGDQFSWASHFTDIQPCRSGHPARCAADFACDGRALVSFVEDRLHVGRGDLRQMHGQHAELLPHPFHLETAPKGGRLVRDGGFEALSIRARIRCQPLNIRSPADFAIGNRARSAVFQSSRRGCSELLVIIAAAILSSRSTCRCDPSPVLSPPLTCRGRCRPDAARRVRPRATPPLFRFATGRTTRECPAIDHGPRSHWGHRRTL